MEGPPLEKVDSQEKLLGHKAKRALPFAVITGGIRVFSGPIAAMLLTHFVTPKEYGAVAAAMIIISLSNLVQAGGLKEYVVKFVECSSGAKLFHTIFLVLSVSLPLWILIALGRNVGASFLGVEEAAAILPVVGVYLVLTPAIALLTALLEQTFRFRCLAGIAICGALIPFAVTLPLAIKGYGIWALVAGMLAERCQTLVLLSVVVRPRINFNLRGMRQTAYEMRQFMVGIMMFQLLGWMFLNVDRLMVSRALGASKLGQYVFSITIIYLLMNLISEGMRPLVFSLAVNVDKSNLGNVLPKRTREMIGLVAPIAFFGIATLLVMGGSIPLLLGKKWSGVGIILPLLSFVLVSSITSLPYEVVKASGRVRLLVFTRIVELLLAIPVYYIAAHVGIKVFAVAVSMIAGVSIILDIWAIGHALGVSPVWLLGDLIRPVGIFAISATVGLAIEFKLAALLGLASSLMIAGFFMAVVYGSLTYCLNRRIITLLVEICRILFTREEGLCI